MRQSRKNASFAFKSLLARASDERDVQKFHRRAPFEARIASARQPHSAHSSLADGRLERVGADFLSTQRRLAVLRARGLDQARVNFRLDGSLVAQGVVPPQERL